MTTTLALAARLRGLDDAVLTTALHRRTYRRTGVADFFDLADALLDADSLQRALAPLDRIHLGVLVPHPDAHGQGVRAVELLGPEAG